MKKIKYITILVTLFYINTYAQNPFLGTWEWQNGNQAFRVQLWDTDKGAVKGHFEMIETNNGVETTVYSSNKPYNSVTPEFWHPIINVGWDGNDKLGGRIMDNSYDYESPEFQQYELCEAWLEMKLIDNNGCVDCPLTASWKVYYYDITPLNAPPINIPTDIIMTKVE